MLRKSRLLKSKENFLWDFNYIQLCSFFKETGRSIFLLIKWSFGNCLKSGFCKKSSKPKLHISIRFKTKIVSYLLNLWDNRTTLELGDWKFWSFFWYIWTVKLGNVMKDLISLKSSISFSLCSQSINPNLTKTAFQKICWILYKTPTCWYDILKIEHSAWCDLGKKIVLVTNKLNHLFAKRTSQKVLANFHFSSGRTYRLCLSKANFGG